MDNDMTELRKPLSSVRMAEWSKAPDSSGLKRQTQGISTFSVVGNSGLRMEAWVQIPLLTKNFSHENINLCNAKKLILFLVSFPP